MIKPVFGIGVPLTDADFNAIRMSKRQAQHAADRLARKTVSDGLSTYAKGFVFDAGEHYRISVCVTRPRAI